jgi:acetyl esterase/lipase
MSAGKLLRGILRIMAALFVLVVIVFVIFSISPAPGAAVIRYMFDKGSADLAKRIESFKPTGITSIKGEHYRPNEDIHLDVYFPEEVASTGKSLPTVVWVHGGGWLSGSKEDAAVYYQSLAKEGFTVIPIDYTIAPAGQYPLPVEQVNDALAYIVTNAERFHVDKDRIFIAGDSAGAQITSQIAMVITGPTDYAVKVQIKPSIAPRQLRGVILHCGFYDLPKFVESAEISPVRFLRWGMSTMIWAYMGKRSPDDLDLRKMSAMYNATPAFPATFISGGNGDPLTDGHSRPFAEKLSSMSVPVTTLFYPAEHQPSLGHEYQFDLNLEDSRATLKKTAEFIRQRQ